MKKIRKSKVIHIELATSNLSPLYKVVTIRLNEMENQLNNYYQPRGYRLHSWHPRDFEWAYAVLIHTFNPGKTA